MDPWGVPPQGVLLSCKDKDSEGRHRVVGIPTFGGGDVRNRSIRDRGIRTPISEYHIPVHFNLVDTVAVYGGG